jgi:hypothetical protein
VSSNAAAEGLTPITLEESAAAIAAVEQFLRDTLPPAPPADPAPPAWLVAALHEGVEREPDLRPW